MERGRIAPTRANDCTLGALAFEQMGMIVEAFDDAIITSTPDGNVVGWNWGAEKMFGFSASEMCGKTTLLVTPDDRHDESREIKARVRRGERVHHHETRRMTKSGDVLDVSLSVFPLHDPAGGLVGTSAIVRDISMAKQSEQQLRALTHRLLHLQDDERRRMARALHDSTAQTLAALAMNLSVLNLKSPALPPEKRAALLSESLTLTQTMVREIRTQSYLLHPALLDERGISAALHWLVESVQQRTGIVAALAVDPTIGRLTRSLETAIFRIVQEALENIHEHSGSARADIEVAANKGWITLSVRDRGAGLPATKSEGFGIIGMRERVLELDGRFSIEGDSSGTTVAVVLPMNL